MQKVQVCLSYKRRHSYFIAARDAEVLKNYLLYLNLKWLKQKEKQLE